MPRTKAGTVPKLQDHEASGQARVSIAGRDHYCGRSGFRPAIAKYHRLLAEYFNGNGSPPVSIPRTGKRLRRPSAAVRGGQLPGLGLDFV